MHFGGVYFGGCFWCGLGYGGHCLMDAGWGLVFLVFGIYWFWSLLVVCCLISGIGLCFEFMVWYTFVIVWGIVIFCF